MDYKELYPLALELGRLFDLDNNLRLQLALTHTLIVSQIYFTNASPYGVNEPLECTFRVSAAIVTEAVVGRRISDTGETDMLWKFYKEWSDPNEIEQGYEEVVDFILNKLSHHHWISKIVYYDKIYNA